MAAALRAADGGGVHFPQILRGVFSKFFRPGGYTTPYPLLFPTPGLNQVSKSNKAKIF